MLQKIWFFIEKMKLGLFWPETPKDQRKVLFFDSRDYNVKYLRFKF